jgi:hypothetical protein
MDVDVTQVSWGKTINIGNYETVRLDLVARVHDGQDWRQVLRALRLLVREQEAKIRPPPEES